MKKRLLIPDEVRKLHTRLVEAGFEGYLVGGRISKLGSRYIGIGFCRSDGRTSRRRAKR